MPLAGGIEQMGYQCGQLWGAALAAGAEAYRLFGPGPRAEAAAVIAAQRLVDSFQTSYKSINCFEVIDLDWKNAQGRQILKFFLKGGPIRCFSMTAGYARATRREIDVSFSDDELEAPEPPVSCAATAGAQDGRGRHARGHGGRAGRRHWPERRRVRRAGRRDLADRNGSRDRRQAATSSSTAPKPPRRSIASCRAPIVNSSAPRSPAGSLWMSTTMPVICAQEAARRSSRR